MDIETFRQQLMIWGVTPAILAMIGFVSLIGLFFSVRVVLKWYLGVQHVQDELRIIRHQLDDLRLQLTAVEIDTDESIAGLSQKPKTSETFRLTH